MCILLTTTGCLWFGEDTDDATSAGQRGSGTGVKVTGLTGVRITIADKGDQPPPAEAMTFSSHVYSLTPSGPLNGTAHIELPLEESAPEGVAPVVATREVTGEPWTYLPAELSADRRSITFTTDHLSLFGAVTIDVDRTLAWFKENFVDGFTANITRNVEHPKCAQEASARADGYTITSSTGPTLHWCFGIEDDIRVLKITNRRNFPLKIAHPNMAVLANKGEVALASLSRFGSGRYLILAPGSTATLSAGLRPEQSVGIATKLDGFGQSLYALQVGIESLAQILTRFGTTPAKSGSQLTAEAVNDGACAASLARTLGDVFASCLSPRQLYKLFGVPGLLLAPLAIAAPVAAFFASQGEALLTQFNNNDRYQIAISRETTDPIRTVKFTETEGRIHIPGQVDTKLGATSADFRAFIARLLRPVAGLAADCATIVSMISWRSDGWAVGGAGGCPGRIALWHRSGGAWREVASTQDMFSCEEVRVTGVPPAFVEACWDENGPHSLTNP